LRKLRANKLKLWKQLKSNPHDFSLELRYKNCVRDWKQQAHECEKQTELRVIDANNLGTFYKYVNKRISYRSGVGALTDSAGSTIVDDSGKANLFNEYFASVGTIDNDVLPPCPCVVSKGVSLKTVEFNVSNVMLAMNKLKSNLSSGPDGLPPLLFKQLKNCLAAPLAMIFTQLLSVAAVPDDWKRAIITPVFKKGVSGLVSNYRPISLTCVPCKIMECIVAQQMYQYFNEHHILNKAQHGFVEGHSTCTNLLESVNDWTLSIQNKRGVTVAYIDFSRAFDTVSHEKLINGRLKSYGISGDLLSWLRNFLSGRTHQTKIGFNLSSVAKLLSGVIQGSGIGPLTFLTYINELIEIMERCGVRIKLFADDAKLYAEIVDIYDVEKLQHAIDMLAEWAELWQLTISISKCCVLNIGNIPADIMPSPNYYLNNNELPVVMSCRDLGVIVSHDLSPSEHINAIVQKAQQRANIILRCFVSRDVTLLSRAFTM